MTTDRASSIAPLLHAIDTLGEAIDEMQEELRSDPSPDHERRIAMMTAALAMLDSATYDRKDTDT